MENVFADFLQNGGLYETITVTEDNVMDFAVYWAEKSKLVYFALNVKKIESSQ